MKWKYGSGLCGLSVVCWVAISALAQAPTADPATVARYLRPSVIPFPSGNPYSQAKADLGRRLFFDPQLSGSRALSCVSCHEPSLSWGDGLPLAIGNDRKPMSRRSPTLLNLAWLPRLGWGGQFKDIETVGFAAVTGSGNMNLAEGELISRLAADPDYVHAFASNFGSDGITRETIEAALATYERTIISGTAPFDRWISGDESAVSAAAKRGFALFNGAAGCAGCHSGWAFTDGSFHDIGTAQADDLGRGQRFPTSVKLRYAFKTPTLRDVTRRAPYMHDGSIQTLEAVIDLYNRGGIERPSRSELIRPLGLTQHQKADLISFLQTLTSDTETAAIPALPR